MVTADAKSDQEIKKRNWYCQNRIQEDGTHPAIKKRDNVNTSATVEMLCLVHFNNNNNNTTFV